MKNNKKPCWRCGKKILRTPGSCLIIPLAPLYSENLYVTVGLPNPTCKKCIDSFYEWFKEGLVKDETEKEVGDKS